MEFQKCIIIFLYTLLQDKLIIERNKHFKNLTCDEVLPMIYHKTVHFAISDIPDKVIIRVIMHCRDIATLIVHTKMNIQHH